jgi:hypothetical protein
VRRKQQHAIEAVGVVRLVRCAIYTRKSTEEGLEQKFNSLDAQRESAEAYISRAGRFCPRATTTGAIAAETWIARRCNDSWLM